MTLRSTAVHNIPSYNVIHPSPTKGHCQSFSPKYGFIPVYANTASFIYTFVFVFFSVSLVYKLKCALYCERCMVCMHKYSSFFSFPHCNDVYSTCTNLKRVNDLPIWNFDVNGSCVVMNIALWFMSQSLLLLMVITFFFMLFSHLSPM